MAVIDDSYIQLSVATPAALAAIPTGDLTAGVICVVQADTNGVTSSYVWTGSAWVLLLDNIDAATAKATLSLIDEILLADSGASFALKKATLTALQTLLVTAAKINTLSGVSVDSADTADNTAAVGSATAAQVETSVDATEAATSNATASTLMERDVNGNASVNKLLLDIIPGAFSVGVSNALIGGTTTILTSAVTAQSVILISRNTPGGTLGFASVPSSAIVAGTSFIINSDSPTDTSTFNFLIIN